MSQLGRVPVLFSLDYSWSFNHAQLSFRLTWFFGNFLAVGTGQVAVPWRWQLENVFSFKGIQDVLVIVTFAQYEAAWTCYLAHAHAIHAYTIHGYAAHVGILGGGYRFGLGFICHPLSDVFKLTCSF